MIGKKFYYIFLLMIACDANSQKRSREVEFILNGGIGSKGNVTPLEGNHPVQSGNLPAFQIGFDYRYHLRGNFSISYGFRLGLIGSELSTDYPIQQISPDYPPGPKALKNMDYVFMLSIPVSLQYQFRTEKPTSYYVQTGLKLNRSLIPESVGTAYIFYGPNGEHIKAFDQSPNLNDETVPSLSLLLGSGIRWRIKNSGPIRTGMIAEYSISKVIRGTYSVEIPGQPDTYGEFSNRLSSLSLVFGYGLHGRTQKPEKAFANFNSYETKKGSVFEKNHYSLGLHLLYTFPVQLITLTGEYLLEADPIPGFNLSGNILFHINRKYSIVSGLNASVIGRNIVLEIDKKRFTPKLKESIDIYGMDAYKSDLFIGIPLGIERRWFGKGAYFSLSTGAILNYYTGPDHEYQEASGIDENNQTVSVARIETNNDSKVSFSAFLNLGYNIPFKNKNILRVAIISNLAFSSYQEGAFTINDSYNVISTGTYTAKANYFGLGFTYMYTQSRYK